MHCNNQDYFARGGFAVPDEESLVKRAQQHDADAFSQLYEANFDKVYRYLVLRVGEGDEAEDMTQQVFINALQSISSFQWRGAPFTAWLYRIAHNQVVDHLRRQNRRITVPIDDLDIKSGDDPVRETENVMNMELLQKASQKLTDAQREAISLRFASDLPIAEVARIMGKSPGAVKALQHSAIAALRKTMGDAL